MLTKTKEQINN